MKQINTFLCCFFMALAGIGFAIGVNNESTSSSYKTANAAPVLNWAQGVTYPLDLRLTAENKYKKDDTEYYVSSGLGIWGGKFRIGTSSEYVVIQIN